jgi:tRNA (guanine37-N1)-methyltransferase
MRGLKVPKPEGESVRQALIQQKLLVPQYKVKSDESFIYFPVKEGIPGYDVVECVFEKRENPCESVKIFGISSFDTIGDIAVVDIPDRLREQNMEIAQTLLKRKHIKTVVQKCSHVHGEFRTRVYEYLAGEQKSKTIHREYGLKFSVDINTVYFNPRLATERMRIAQKVEPGEVVTDMFCGVGPFSIMISRYSEAQKIVAIDINPTAVKLLRENLILNKIENVIPVLGDAREELSRIGHTDRILMNLPQKAFEFLPAALQHKSIIHYYTITSDVKEEIERIKTLHTELTTEILGYHPVKSYSPDMKICRIDIAAQ